jgi:hypothetical protein
MPGPLIRVRITRRGPVAVDPLPLETTETLDPEPVSNVQTRHETDAAMALVSVSRDTPTRDL